MFLVHVIIICLVFRVICRVELMNGHLSSTVFLMGKGSMHYYTPHVQHMGIRCSQWECDRTGVAVPDILEISVTFKGKEKYYEFPPSPFKINSDSISKLDTMLR